MPSPGAGLGVAGTFQEAIREAVLLVASRVAEHTGNEADDSFSDDQHRYFPTDEYIVSDRDLFDSVVAGGIVDDALVNALVAPTSEHNVVLRRPGPRHVLSKGLTGGRRHDEQRFLIDTLLITATVHVGVTRLNEVGLRRFQQGRISNTNGNIVECRSPDLGFHDHARSSAVGRVVDGFMHVCRPVPKVVYADLKNIFLNRLA